MALFQAMGTQWCREIAPSGRIVWWGLDYGHLDAVQRRLAPTPGLEQPAEYELFYQLRVLEAEALSHLNNRD